MKDDEVAQGRRRSHHASVSRRSTGSDTWIGYFLNFVRGSPNASVIAFRAIESTKWRLWHGRWQVCLIKLASPLPLSTVLPRRHFEGTISTSDRKMTQFRSLSRHGLPMLLRALGPSPSPVSFSSHRPDRVTPPGKRACHSQSTDDPADAHVDVSPYQSLAASAAPEQALTINNEENDEDRQIAQAITLPTRRWHGPASRIHSRSAEA